MFTFWVSKDVFTPECTHGHGPKPAHLQGILRFVAQSGREPLLVQCWAGRSRSTAVAFVVIVKSLWEQGIDGPALVRRAADALLAIRPLDIPNRLVLRLGLEEFLAIL